MPAGEYKHHGEKRQGIEEKGHRRAGYRNQQPPIAGPTALAAFIETPPRATAAGTSSRGTSSGVVACQAGELRAEPRPRRNVSPRSSHGVMMSANVSTASAEATNSIQ